MSTVTGNKKSQSSGSTSYALMQPGQRRVPNALPIVKQGSSNGSTLPARRGSRHSMTGSTNGGNFGSLQAGGSKEGWRGSKALTGLQAAGASTISAQRLPGSKHASKQGFFPGTQLMATNTALGRLPTLGLNQIKLDEFDNEENNMFKVHDKTEHLLVARELEREFKDLNKFEKDNLRIWEKGTSTRIDRKGNIKIINSIPALKPDLIKKKGGYDAGGTNSTDELQAAQNKQKLNIFDAQDSQVLKAETLQRLGHDEKALVSIDAQSQASSVFSSQRSEVGRPKTIEYLNKGSQQKETVRDFISNSRKILMAQIQINQKKEETELLKEYIIMEKDKLEEGKKTFQEDKEKYEKFKMDLTAKSLQTDTEVKNLNKQIEDLISFENELKKEEGELNSKNSKIEEEITSHKAHKKFLDLIAIAANIKKPMNQKERRMMKEIRIAAERETQSFDDEDRPSFDQRGSNMQARQNDTTFITSVKQQTMVERKQSKTSVQRGPGGKNSSLAKHVALEIDEVDENEEKVEENVEEEEFNTSEIDWNADYSDDDDRVPLNEKEFWGYLEKLEENNLFEMNLLQENQQTLEKIARESSEKVAAKKLKLDDLNQNTRLLEESLQGREDRLMYYKNIIVSSDGGQGAAAKSLSTGGRSNAALAGKSGKGSNVTIKEGKIRNSAGEESKGAMTMTRGNRGISQSAFNVYLLKLGGTREQIRTINDYINDLVEKAGVKQEDMSDKIALLKKVEIKFHELVEHRKVYNFFEPISLKSHETEIRQKAKNLLNEKNRLKNARQEAEKDGKTLARIKYKEELVVPRNIRNTTRSKKNDPKRKADQTVAPKPEEEEMRRYLGIVPEDWNIPGGAAASQKE